VSLLVAFHIQKVKADQKIMGGGTRSDQHSAVRGKKKGAKMADTPEVQKGGERCWKEGAV